MKTFIIIVYIIAIIFVLFYGKKIKQNPKKVSKKLNVKQLLKKLFKKFHPNKRHYYTKKAAIKVYKKLQNINNFSAMINYLRQINPFVFEELILYAFKKKGMKIYRNKRYTGDGGIDGKVRFHKKLILIQAKRYTNYINLNHVRDFAELCTRKRKNGFFIHTGKTGDGSKKILESYKNVRIISGQYLLELFHDTKTVNIHPK